MTSNMTSNMNCEIVAVGTELLLGQIVDTNSSWIGEQLAAVGINSHYQTKVGDNWDRITQVLRQAIARSDAVIVTGGLGPTQDDITREVLASLMGVELELDATIAQRIREMFEARGRAMPENNLRQAMVPQGAKLIAEQPGTAPGLIAELPRAAATDPAEVGPTGAGSTEASPAEAGPTVVVYLVPGVPREMKEMLNGTVLADLRARAGHTDVITSRVLRTWGESESGLAELLSDRIAALDEIGNPTLAFLASGIEGIKVRITAKAASQPAANSLLDAETKTLCELLGSIVFSVNDESMEQVVLQRLLESGQTLAVAETFTGGLMANRLSAVQQAAGWVRAQQAPTVPGTSAFANPFRGGLVVPDQDEQAGQLASFIREKFETDWGIAASGPGLSSTVPSGTGLSGTGLSGTGSSSPRSSSTVPSGTGSSSPRSSSEVTLAVATADKLVTKTIVLPNDAQQRSNWATISTIDMLRHEL